jgi:hypothetical protein
MKRITVLVVVVATSLAVVAITASGSAQTKRPRTLRLFEAEKGSTFEIIDQPPAIKNDVLSVGDQLVSSGLVFNRARTQRRGRSSVHCITETPGRAPAGAEQLCTAAFRLRGGLITVTAAFRNQAHPVGAITGGTGAYAGAGGTFESRQVKGGSVDTFTLR